VVLFSKEHVNSLFVQPDSGSHQRFYWVGDGALFPGGKAASAWSGTLTARSRDGQTCTVPALPTVRLSLRGFHKDNLAFNFC